MAESGLSIGLPELRNEVCFYLGYGRDYDSASSDAQSFVDDIIDSGVRRVYFPPSAQIPTGEKTSETIVGHKWSWMTKDTTFSLTDGDAAQDLPDDFASIDGKFHFSSGSDKLDVPIIEANDVYSMLADNATEGVPKYAAINAKTTDGATGQRFEVLWYPVPDTSYTANYSYNVLTYALSDSYPYPLGGMSLSELYIASCIAVAEERTDKNTGRANRFKSLLIDAIIRDRALKEEQVKPYFAVDTTWGYNYFKQKVATMLGYGAASSLWTDAQTNEIDSFVQAGIRRVYYPADAQNKGYKWSFMRPETTLSVEDGDAEYDFPAGFGSMRGRFHFDDEELYPPVEEISVGDMRDLWARVSTSGPPQYAAIFWNSSSNTAAQTQSVKFWPEPDADYTLHYQYEAKANALSSAAPYPLGGQEIAEVYVESCLALVEQYKAGKPGAHTQQYVFLLNDAIARDRQRGAKRFGYLGARQHAKEWRRGYDGYPATITYNDEPIT